MSNKHKWCYDVNCTVKNFKTCKECVELKKNYFIDCPKCGSEIRVERHPFGVTDWLGTCRNKECDWRERSTSNHSDFRRNKKSKARRKIKKEAQKQYPTYKGNHFKKNDTRL